MARLKVLCNLDCKSAFQIVDSVMQNKMNVKALSCIACTIRSLDN